MLDLSIRSGGGVVVPGDPRALDFRVFAAHD